MIKSKHKIHHHNFDKYLENFVAIISIIYIILMIFELYIPRIESYLNLIIIIDTVICFIFLYEFFHFLYRSKNKKKYFKTGIWDLLSSIPYLLIFSFSPLSIVFNIFKLLRGVKNILKLYEVLLKRSISMFLKIFSAFLLIIIYFTLIVVYIEKDVNSGLSTFHDGLWWAITTVTSVGYGDVSPVTYSGKFVTTFLMIFGVGISSAVGAMFVTNILKPTEDKLLREEERIESEEKKIELQEEESKKREEKILKNEKLILDKLDKLEKKLDKQNRDNKKKENIKKLKTKTI